MSLPPEFETLVSARILYIEPWIDPVVEGIGFELRDPYVEFCLAVIPWETGVPERCPPADN